MDDLTQDEIEKIEETIFEPEDYAFCMYLTKSMMGYLRMPPFNDGERIHDTRQYFFRHIKMYLDRKADEKTTTATK